MMHLADISHRYKLPTPTPLPVHTPVPYNRQLRNKNKPLLGAVQLCRISLTTIK
jgi:hypothetical protein